MNSRFLMISTALTLISTAALASDLLPRKTAPVFDPPIPVFTWTGLYVGLQVGEQIGNNVIGEPFFGTSVSRSTSGVTGGAHIGYNVSAQSFPGFGSVLGAGGVFGVEGDVDATSTHLTVAAANYRSTVQGSVRARMGVAVDRALFYATGGVAIGAVRDSYHSVRGFDLATPTRIGFTVGGGVEFAVTNNLALRTEYRYSDFGTYTDTLTNANFGLAVRHHESDHRVQSGLDYKFETFAPVVARY